MKKHALTLLSVLCTTVAMSQYIGTFLSTGAGSGPTGITRDGSGNFYVMLRGQQKVVKIDPQLNVTDYCTSGLPPHAMGLALDGQGNLYVAGYTSGSVLQIPPGGGPAVPYATGIPNPVDIKQYDGDTLVVRGSTAVYKIHPGGGVAGSATVPQLFTHSDGLYGGLFIYANKDFGLINSQLQRVDKSTFAFTYVAAMPVNSGYPVLLSNRFGTDQFYMPMGSSMYRVDAATGASVAVPSSYPFGEAYGAVADEDANYWVTEFTFDRISTYLEDCTSSTNLTVSACEQYEFGGNSLTQSGTYTNTLTNIYNCDSVVTLELTINPLPVITAVASEYTPCIGQAVALSATGADVFQWDNSLGSGAQHNITATQTTIFTAYGIDGNGCQSSDTVEVTVVMTPNIQISASPQEICLGELVDLSATGADDFDWDNGLGAGSMHTLNPQQTTTYIVTGTTSGCQTTASVTVTVNPLPEVTAQSNDLQICVGESTLLTASGSTVVDWLWMGGISTTASVSVSPIETTMYTVFGTDANGCVGYDEITVDVETCVGIGEATIATDMKVWVEAEQNMVVFRDLPAPCILTVTDMMGRLVYSEQVNTASGQIQLPNDVKGMCLVSVTDREKRTSYKAMMSR